MDLKELENGVNPATHWYYQSKKLPLLRYARQLAAAGRPLTVVDIGSGSGFFAYELDKALGTSIAKIYLVDIGYSEAEMAATRGQKIEKVHAVPALVENGLFVLMDVLEHLPDDLAMLQTVKAAGAGGHYFITVPAFQALWSGHDDFLGHYRRYRIPMLRDVLRRADFQSVRSYYLYGGIFPLVWGVRMLGKLRGKEAASSMRPAPALANRLLLTLNAAEMALAPLNRLAGVTCVAQGRV